MNPLRRLCGPVALFTLAGSLVVVSRTDAAEVCKQIHASNQSHAVTCGGPFGLCTVGQVTGDGLLRGTTLFTVTGLDTSTGLNLGDLPTTLSDAGTWTATTAHGTLTTSSVGMLDLAKGLFFDLGRISGGTGRFEGAAGTLFFSGSFSGNFPALQFEGDIRGEVCLMK
jgi:hypothetical protein